MIFSIRMLPLFIIGLFVLLIIMLWSNYELIIYDLNKNYIFLKKIKLKNISAFFYHRMKSGKKTLGSNGELYNINYLYIFCLSHNIPIVFIKT